MSRLQTPFTALSATLSLAMLIAAPASAGDHRATVTRTAYGIPHIQADDFASLGYGYGYVFAEDNLCVMLDDFITTRGERSRYFGPDATYSIPAVPVTSSNLDSDFFWKLLADAPAVQRFRAGTLPLAQQLTSGYVEGFNRYLGELQAGQHPGAHAACANAAWLQPITEDDLYRRYIRLALLASSEALVTEIATAAPPAAGQATPSDAEMAARLARVAPGTQPFARLHQKAMGSNMMALGPQATADGSSMVYGNPHFPWTGSERLYPVHLTVPGQMDIAGVSLYGSPVVLIGYNNHVAWSHTVSTAYRFTLYQLKLDRNSPTRYQYTDAQGRRSVKDMQAVPLSVQVKQPDGRLATATRTLYRSMYGPMLIISEGGVPVLGWTQGTAFTLRDANLENNRLINQYFQWNTATSLAQFKQLHASVLGTPWVNTVASGPGGSAYYGDVSVVPNVPDELAQTCATPLFSAAVNALIPGLPLLDGSRAKCQWLNDADASVPGIFGGGSLPTLERPDWVANMNDSYWLTNAEHPFNRRYARIIGDFQTARTLRTRLGIRQIQGRLDGSDGLGTPYRFDLPRLQHIVLSARVYSGELAQAQVLNDLCPRAGRFDTAAACAGLRLWDRAATLDSVGLPVWQEFWNAVVASGVNPWSTPFDVNDPVNTPRDLNTRQPAIRQALATAQQRLQQAGMAMSAPLRTQQFSGISAEPIPIFGAEGQIGTFTVADTVAGATASHIEGGRYPVIYGNSYLQTVTWNAGGVHAEALLSYSVSTDPANPHFNDFTKAYSAQQWLAVPFHRDDVRAQQLSRRELVGQ